MASVIRVRSRANQGLNSPEIIVEIHLANGLPAYNLVGLAETTVKEAKERVRSAIICCDLQFPDKRIVVNLAPADLPKQGGRYDLPIAIGLLAASEQISAAKLDAFEFFGELSLAGELKPFSGAFPVVIAALNANRQVIVPMALAHELQALKRPEILFADDLQQVVNFLQPDKRKRSAQHPQKLQANELKRGEQIISRSAETPKEAACEENFRDIRGQQTAKRAALIAAAGGHNLLMFGPPGSGKSMIAARIAALLPPLTQAQAIETYSLYSLSGTQLHFDYDMRAPFRQPHHTSSRIALIGGGQRIQPGEISLANHGILFLDELTEFPRTTLDSLREPLETQQIHISRANQKLTFPASIQLVCALNPSPSGDINDGRVSQTKILNYLNKISGPLIDRIDLQIQVDRVDLTVIDSAPVELESTEQMRARVLQLRELQLQRQGTTNALLGYPELGHSSQMNPQDKERFLQLAERSQLSMRSLTRCLRVARTTADLMDSPQIEYPHLLEAMAYRRFDQLIQQLSRGQ